MKKFLIILVVGILIVGIAFLVSKNINSNNTNTQNTKVTNTTKQNTQTKTNTTNSNTAKNEINNTVENIVNENVQETGNTETFNETPETELDKAISIVKNNWQGEDVSFSSQGMDNNGNYIIQVTNANTEVLAFYIVNVSDGTFTVRY